MGPVAVDVEFVAANVDVEVEVVADAVGDEADELTDGEVVEVVVVPEASTTRGGSEEVPADVDVDVDVDGAEAEGDGEIEMTMVSVSEIGDDVEGVGGGGMRGMCAVLPPSCGAAVRRSTAKCCTGCECAGLSSSDFDAAS